jgi:hypothetical protein
MADEDETIHDQPEETKKVDDEVAEEKKIDKPNENSQEITNDEIENDLSYDENDLSYDYENSTELPPNDSGNEADKEYYDEEEENIADKYEENTDEDGMSDELFSKVLSDLITLKSRTEVKKKQSKVIPCAKKFLSLGISQRSKSMTNIVRKNLLHICDFVYKGKFPINISIDNKRFLKHLLDKRTPKEDVEITLTEDLRTHAIIREVIDQIENSDGYGTR